MKTFSKTSIIMLLISLFVVSSGLAQNYFYKASGDSTENKSLSASTTQVVGPFSVEAIEWTNSTTMRAYFNDGSHIDCNGISGGTVLITDALALKAALYLIIASDNSVSNFGLIY